MRMELAWFFAEPPAGSGPPLLSAGHAKDLRMLFTHVLGSHALCLDLLIIWPVRAGVVCCGRA